MLIIPNVYYIEFLFLQCGGSYLNFGNLCTVMFSFVAGLWNSWSLN